jgi:uncharacterized MAPEG superfamily protein
MSASLVALLGFAAWTIALVLVVLLFRTAIVFAGRKRANSWPRGEKPPADEPGIITRIGHAHQNCLEGLPIFAAIVAAAAAAGKLGVTDPVAMWVLYARVAQSVTHMIGVTHWLVFIRANFFTVQLLLYGYMIWGLLR